MAVFVHLYCSPILISFSPLFGLLRLQPYMIDLSSLLSCGRTRSTSRLTLYLRCEKGRKVRQIARFYIFALARQCFSNWEWRWRKEIAALSANTKFYNSEKCKVCYTLSSLRFLHLDQRANMPGFPLVKKYCAGNFFPWPQTEGSLLSDGTKNAFAVLKTPVTSSWCLCKREKGLPQLVGVGRLCFILHQQNAGLFVGNAPSSSG